MKNKKTLIGLVISFLSITTLLGCGNKKDPEPTPTPEPTELAITKQPVNVSVAYPDAPSFEVEVNNAKLVKAYDWDVLISNSSGGGGEGPFGDTEDVWERLDGSDCHSSKLTIPFTTAKTGTRTFRCVITDINDKQIISESCKYTLTNKQDFVPFGNLGQYTIRPGTTLDLSKTEYGKGTISLDSTGKNYTFSNVQFNNQFSRFHSGMTPTAFEIETWNNPADYSEYTLTFEGVNTFTNYFWQEEHNEGGCSFYFGFVGDSIKPTVKMLAKDDNSSLTIVGGTFAILAYTNVYIDININITGNPKRLTKGIICDALEIAPNTIINANTGGTLIFTQTEQGFEKESNVIINEGCIIRGIFDLGKVSDGSTVFYGISAADNLEINKATIDLDIVSDNEFFSKAEQTIAPVCGLASHRAKTIIKDSDISIKYRDINEPVVAGIVTNNIEGISSPYVEIATSDIYINMVGKYGYYGAGITCLYCEITDSNVEINIASKGRNTGIYSQATSTNDTAGILKIYNSQVDIICDSEDGPVDERLVPNSAIMCRYPDFRFKGNETINVSAENGFAITVIYEVVNSKQGDPTEKKTRPYSPVNFDTSMCSIELFGPAYEWNVDYFKRATLDGELYYFNYEAMYKIDGGKLSDQVSKATFRATIG